MAVLLAAALVYTSFSASTEAKEPSELLVDAAPGESYDLTGEVVDDSVEHDGTELRFEIADREDPSVRSRSSTRARSPIRSARAAR